MITCPDSDDLAIDLVAPEIARITSRFWEGTVLIAAEKGVQGVEGHVHDDVRHAMAVAEEPVT